MNSENSSLESSIKQSLQSLNESLTQCLGDFEDRVRSAPLAAVSLGLSVGYLLRFFPLTFILGIVLRLFLFSLKPLILLFGAMKLFELVRKSGEDRAGSDRDRDREPLLDSPSGPPAA